VGTITEQRWAPGRGRPGGDRPGVEIEAVPVRLHPRRAKELGIAPDHAYVKGVPRRSRRDTPIVAPG
jgi:hypothetical protein